MLSVSSCRGPDDSGDYSGQMFGPAGFLILLQLSDHAYDPLIHALNLAIGLSMVRRGSQLLHPYRSQRCVIIWPMKAFP